MNQRILVDFTRVLSRRGNCIKTLSTVEQSKRRQFIVQQYTFISMFYSGVMQHISPISRWIAFEMSNGISLRYRRQWRLREWYTQQRNMCQGIIMIMRRSDIERIIYTDVPYSYHVAGVSRRQAHTVRTEAHLVYCSSKSLKWAKCICMQWFLLKRIESMWT